MIKLIKKLLIIITLIITSTILFSCNNDDEKYDIMTSSYIPYDIATNIVKDNLKVGLIVPFGAEVHHFEQTTKDMKNIKSYELFTEGVLDKLKVPSYEDVLKDTSSDKLLQTSFNN